MAKHHLTCLLLIIFHFSGASGYLIGRGIADITGLVAEGLLVRKKFCHKFHFEGVFNLKKFA